MPGDRLRPPEPVALHLAPLLGGRRADERLATGWLGRYLDRVGAPGQPAPGALARREPAARARDREACRSRRSTRPTSYDFWARGVWGDGRGADARRDRRARRAARRRRPGPRGRRQTRRARRPGSYQQLGAVPAKDDDKPFGSPVAYPSRDDPFPRRLAGLAAMLAAGLPMRVRRAHGAGRLRHARQPGGRRSPTRLKLTADSLLAFQRDLEARGLADRVLVHVWSEFGRRAQENGSGGTDHGAAGVGFLIGSRAAGTDDRRVPRRSTQPRRATATCAPPPTSARLYAALLEDWLGADAEGDHPGRARVRAAAHPQVRRALAALAAPPAAALAPGRVRSRPTSSPSRSRAPGSGRSGDRPTRRLRRGRAQPRSATADRGRANVPDPHDPARGQARARASPPAGPLLALVHARRPPARGMRATLLVRPA